MGAINIDELYKAAENSRLTAFETARKDSLRRLQTSLDGIGTTYRNNVTQAQSAARISALGQEEKLAAAGLSGGSAYAAPTSGYTESARIASDNNLRSNLNALSLKKLQQEQNARTASNTEISQALQDYNNGISDIRSQLARAKIEQYNTDRQYEESRKQNAYAQAMERWKIYGFVLPADAAILGVKAGTQTADSAYDRARLELERWKTLVKL